jgi:hypothetical protein
MTILRTEPTYDDPDVLDGLAELEAIRDRRAARDDEEHADLDRRLAVFLRLRSRVPPVDCWVLGQRSGITEAGVTAVLKKASEKQARSA